MTVTSLRTPVYLLVIGSRIVNRKKVEALHATDPYDCFAPLCGAMYTTAQTVAVAGGLHAAPLSCAECMRLAPYVRP